MNESTKMNKAQIILILTVIALTSCSTSKFLEPNQVLYTDVEFQFENEERLSEATPQLKVWQRKLSASLLKKGVILKQGRQHLIFTVESPED